MRLALNLLVQTIVWFGAMGAIIFGAAGTTDYAGGWLYLGEMLAISVVLGLHTARVDPDLLKERLKPPLQKDQPLADKLVLIPILLLMLGGMGVMAADAARWHWSAMPSSVQWTGCALLLAAVPILALLLGIRIGIEEKSLRMGLEGYDDYARRVPCRLIPFIW